MKLIKNKIYRAQLVDYTADGSAVARIGGIAVFVRGGAVGDQCDIRIVKVNQRMAFGKIETIVVRSKHRTQPLCPYAGRCGGCCWQHLTYEEELRAKKKKVEDALRRIGGLDLSLDPVIGAPSITHYRNKAQYPVGHNQDGAITGFYRVRTHDIVPISHCLIQSEKTDLAAQIIRQWMNTYHVPAYDPESQHGVLRHIYVRVGDASGQTHICLVSSTPRLPAQEALIQALTEQIPSLVGIVVNINRSPKNTILGAKTILLWGEPVLEDTLCGNTFLLSPHSFYQVNHAQAEALYQCAIEYAGLDGTQTVVELYCGAGTITLAMARHAAKVIGVEVVPEAVENARENAARNEIANVEFICADAGQSAAMLAHGGIRPAVLVVDPPRKGLDETATASIGLMAPARIVYISCDPATLARDIKILAQDGYAVQKCQVYDMFPRTAHVETVCLMSRAEK